MATTEKVAVSGVLPAFAAVKEGTFPVPLFTPKPMASLVRDQEKVAPGTLLVNTTDGTVAPTQYAMLATAFTVGFGLIVMVN